MIFSHSLCTYCGSVPILAISDQFQIPVRYIGVGEGISDLQKFNKEEFVDSLFN